MRGFVSQLRGVSNGWYQTVQGTGRVTSDKLRYSHSAYHTGILRRGFATAAAGMSSPKLSQGSDEAKVNRELSTLLQAQHPWELCANGQGVERAFQFKTFKAAWAFMNSVAESAKTEKHHPEWSNTYNRVFVRWTTHNPAGLSEKDTHMATLCDELAKRPETLEIMDEDATATLSLRQTADQAADGACCSPRAPGRSTKATERQKVEAVEKEEGAQGSVAGIGGQPS